MTAPSLLLQYSTPKGQRLASGLRKGALGPTDSNPLHYQSLKGSTEKFTKFGENMNCSILRSLITSYINLNSLKIPGRL